MTVCEGVSVRTSVFLTRRVSIFIGVQSFVVNGFKDCAVEFRFTCFT